MKKIGISSFVITTYGFLVFFFAESYYGMTSYMPYVDGGYPTFMDCDDLLSQGAHYPFQHSLDGWC